MRIATTLAIVTAALAAAAPCIATDKATENQLKAEYLKYVKAVKAKDIDTLNSMMAPDFKMRMKNQTYDRKQASDMMKQQFKSMKSFDKWDYKFGPMTRRGNTVTTIVYEDTASTAVGPDGKTHKVTDKGTMQTRFRRIGGQWKVTDVRSLKDRMTIDGKPFDPTAAMNRQRKMAPGMKKMQGMKKDKM